MDRVTSTTHSFVVHLRVATMGGGIPKSDQFVLTGPQGIQGSAKRWGLGCVNPAFWLPLAAGASSRNLGPTF